MSSSLFSYSLTSQFSSRGNHIKKCLVWPVTRFCGWLKLTDHVIITWRLRFCYNLWYNEWFSASQVLSRKAQTYNRWHNRKALISKKEMEMSSFLNKRNHIKAQFNLALHLRTKVEPLHSLQHNSQHKSVMEGGMVQNSRNQNRFQHQQPICSSTFSF